MVTPTLNTNLSMGDIVQFEARGICAPSALLAADHIPQRGSARTRALATAWDAASKQWRRFILLSMVEPLDVDNQSATRRPFFVSQLDSVMCRPSGGEHIQWDDLNEIEVELTDLASALQRTPAACAAAIARHAKKCSSMKLSPMSQVLENTKEVDDDDSDVDSEGRIRDSENEDDSDEHDSSDAADVRIDHVNTRARANGVRA